MAERIEDLNLPLSVVSRIIKATVPNVIVSKESRNAIATAASVFVLYLTSTSNQNAVAAGRKTISANDVFKALEENDFEMFVDPLREALEVSVVARIIKDAVQNVVVSKDSRRAIAKAASLFVLHLTSTANDNAVAAGRKTINANDVFKALDDTEFDSFLNHLKEAFDAYKKTASEKKLKQKKASKGAQNGTEQQPEAPEPEEEEEMEVENEGGDVEEESSGEEEGNKEETVPKT